MTHPDVPQGVEDAFQALAMEQRGFPEEAMHDIYGSKVANSLYGFCAEHTGDLIHRMSQTVNFFRGGGEWVNEKVEKVLHGKLSPGRDRLSFDADMEQTVHSELKYYTTGKGRKYASGYWASVEKPSVVGAYRELMRLGKLYANEHEKLPTYNRAQFYANRAAISLGLFHFDETRRYLQYIERLLKNASLWEYAAMEYRLDERGRLLQYGMWR